MLLKHNRNLLKIYIRNYVVWKLVVVEEAVVAMLS